MTPAELMAIHPTELAKISDKELGERLAPLFPAVRAPYAGSREKIVTLPSGVRTSKRGLDKSAEMLASILSQTRPSTSPENQGQSQTFQTQPLTKLRSRYE